MRTRHAEMRDSYRSAVEAYFRRITEPGWTPDDAVRALRDLGAIALKLHFYEQGMGAAKREKR